MAARICGWMSTGNGLAICLTTIEEKLDTLEEKDTIPTPPQVSYRSDVVDTDNKWPETDGQLTPAEKGGQLTQVGVERLHRIIKDRG